MKSFFSFRDSGIAAVSFILFISCNGQTENAQNISKDTIPTQSDMSIAGSFSNQTSLTFDSNYVNSFLKQYPLLNPFKKNLDTFYHYRNFAFAWFDKNGKIEQASNLLNKMENIKEEGLKDTIPYQSEFTELMNNDGLDSTGKPSVFTELMLTSQYFYYANKVWQGFDEQQLESINWYLPKKKVSYNQLLDSLIQGKDILDKAPVFRQYALLKDYLKKYREIQAAGGFPQVNTEKSSYKKGDSSATLAIIRNILAQTGDLANDNHSAAFDEELENGVKSYQGRFGMKTDGVIGNAFIKEINTPIEERIEQVIVNMERSRWVPVNLSGNYFVVNIPDFKMYVFEHDTISWTMNVVVGQPAHKTVIFNGELKYIVFSPYWNVPTSIKNKEILPAMRRNKNYLASHNMEWNGGNVRQKPGSNNALGLVKFLFPNSHSIYLHDTPSKSLFGESKRAFSHGCIRLAEPQKLAEYLLRNDSSWNRTKIVAAMHAGKEKYVTLKDPIPVFIAYFTAWVTRDGKINFRNDVYARDGRISEMLIAGN